MVLEIHTKIISIYKGSTISSTDQISGKKGSAISSTDQVSGGHNADASLSQKYTYQNGKGGTYDSHKTQFKSKRTNPYFLKNGCKN